jgi:hypothetical protein
MNAIKLTSLKVTVCGAAALALTLMASYTFVDSNSVLRVARASTSMVANTAAHGGAHLAQSTSTGLLQ